MPSLDFKGKQFVYTHHLTVPFRELVVDAKKSLPAKGNPSMDDNLIIHGDNLHALKALLPRYAGKVKCIYIDPPYNTGNEGWCYNDNVRSPLMQEWIKHGNPVEREDMERHDKWLSMMWPRLNLLRELLREDGAIFISIDDNELNNLRAVMNEVFGEDNFVGQITTINNLKGRNDKKNLSTINDYVLIYQKSAEFETRGLPLTAERMAEYKFVDVKGGKYKLRDLRKRGRPDRREDRPNMWFSIFFHPDKKIVSLDRKSKEDVEITPFRGDGTDGRWRWGRESVAENLDILYPRYNKKKGRWDIDHRVYLSEAANEEIPGLDDLDEDEELSEETRSKAKTVWMGGEFSTDVGGREIKDIFGSEAAFDYPKPTGVIERCLQLCTDKEDIVLDSFAGSGTTAHAVLALNREDGGNRKFILLECEDYADRITAGARSPRDQRCPERSR